MKDMWLGIKIKGRESIFSIEILEGDFSIVARFNPEPKFTDLYKIVKAIIEMNEGWTECFAIYRSDGEGGPETLIHHRIKLREGVMKSLTPINILELIEIKGGGYTYVRNHSPRFVNDRATVLVGIEVRFPSKVSSWFSINKLGIGIKNQKIINNT